MKWNMYWPQTVRHLSMPVMGPPFPPAPAAVLAAAALASRKSAPAVRGRMKKSGSRIIGRSIHGMTRGAIGSLHPFLGSLGAGAGGSGSHHAMQKPTWAFRLVANITSREPKGPVWLVPCASHNRLNWIQGRLFGKWCACYLVTSSLWWWG
jgi:hypothetical protein